MRRIVLLLGLVMAFTTVGAAPAEAATTITTFQLKSARLAKGLAVQLTFKASCRNFNAATGTIEGRIEQRVRGHLVSAPIHEVWLIQSCGASEELTAIGGSQAGKLALHPGRAVIDARFVVCDNYEESPCGHPHVAHIRTATSLVPIREKTRDTSGNFSRIILSVRNCRWSDSSRLRPTGW